MPKVIIKNYNVIANRKNFFDQPIDSDIKRYEGIRKLITAQDKDYTTGCLLDYDYIKNHYRLIADDLSWQKELDADLKEIQEIEFVGQLKNPDIANTDGAQYMFVLTILEKNQRNKTKKFSGKCKSLVKDRKL